MRLIDLTMPIWPGAGYGEILPFTNTPVEFIEYMDYSKNGMRQTQMKLNGETGSPLMVPAQHAPFDMTPLQKSPRFNWTLNEIPLEAGQGSEAITVCRSDQTKTGQLTPDGNKGRILGAGLKPLHRH